MITRVLYFSYPFECQKEAETLHRTLNTNNIQHIYYKSNSHYNHEFVVVKSGKKWNDIYKIINSVKASHYRFKNVDLEVYDGKLTEIIRIFCDY